MDFLDAFRNPDFKLFNFLISKTGTRIFQDTPLGKSCDSCRDLAVKKHFLGREHGMQNCSIGDSSTQNGHCVLACKKWDVPYFPGHLADVRFQLCILLISTILPHFPPFLLLKPLLIFAQINIFAFDRHPESVFFLFIAEDNHSASCTET